MEIDRIKLEYVGVDELVDFSSNNELESTSHSRAQHENNQEKNWKTIIPKEEDRLKIPRKPFPCTLCSTSYDYQKDLSKHMKHKHPNLKAMVQNSDTGFYCALCGKSLARLWNLLRHIQEVHIEKKNGRLDLYSETMHKIECNMCPEICTSATSLLSHIKNSHQLYQLNQFPSTAKQGKTKAIPVTNTCTHCSKTFSSESGLNLHLVLQHNEKNVNVKTCPLPKKNQEQKDWEKIKPREENLMKTPPGKSFSCTLCPTTYQRQKDLSMHMKHTHPNLKFMVENPDTSFYCALCGKALVRLWNLLRHIQEVHIEKKNGRLDHHKVECNMCPEIFTSATSLLSHIKNSHQQYQYPWTSKQGKPKPIPVTHTCKHCSKTYSSKYFLNLHLARKHNENNSNVKTYPCELCGHICYTLKRLERHVVDVHVVDKSVECHVCEKKFVDETDLARHFETVHERSFSRHLRCDVCSLVFDKEPLIRHLRVEHGRFFNCDKCSRSFETKTCFDEHSASIVSDLSQLQCQICLRCLPTSCSLNTHTDSHLEQIRSKVKKVKVTEENQFKCELCSKSFAYRKYLSQHRRQVHHDSKWECNFCTKMFITHSQLRAHKQQIHSIVKSYVCKKCPKTFTRPLDLKIHERSHEQGNRQCLICNKIFASPSALKVHMGTYHRGKRPFKCHICKLTWTCRSQLTSHLHSHFNHKPCPCNKCGKLFKSSKSLRLHHRFVHLAISPKIRSNILEHTNDDSLVFICSLCDFETKDRKEVALHSSQHGLPKVLVSKPFLCVKHNSSVYSLKMQSASDSSKSLGSCSKSEVASVNTKERERSKSTASTCDFCSPVTVRVESGNSTRRLIQTRFECERCCSLFKTKSALTIHLKFPCDKKDPLETAKKPFQCKLCPRSYAYNVNLQIHMKQKHSNHQSGQSMLQDEENFIQCPLCPKSFSSLKPTKFINHLNDDHAENKGVVLSKDLNDGRAHCPLCPKSFSTKHGRIKHVLYSHVEHKPFECQICKRENNYCRKFVDQKSLDKHTSDFHKPTPVKCDICLKTFKSSHNLNQHRNSHLKAPSTLKCLHCLKSFSCNRTLNRHLVVKHKEKNPKVKTYTCELCGKTYVCKWKLGRHLADVHVVDKSVECQVCGKMFVDEIDLAQHVNRAHNEKFKVFTCDVCSEGFSMRQYLVRHLGVKHRRFFDCDKCRKSFGTKTDFDQHSTIVSDSAELQCHICHVFLPSNCSFNVHTKSHVKQIESKVIKLQVIEDESPAEIN